MLGCYGQRKSSLSKRLALGADKLNKDSSSTAGIDIKTVNQNRVWEDKSVNLSVPAEVFLPRLKMTKENLTHKLSLVLKKIML